MTVPVHVKPLLTPAGKVPVNDMDIQNIPLTENEFLSGVAFSIGYRKYQLDKETDILMELCNGVKDTHKSPIGPLIRSTERLCLGIDVLNGIKAELKFRTTDEA
jgi:hypothetical protein